MKLLLLLILLFITTISFAQGSIKGRITSEDGRPVPGTTLALRQQNTVASVTANSEGYFEFTNVANGKYEVEASAIGFASASQNVTVNNSGAERNFVLLTATAQLQNVEIIGRTARRYTSDYSFGATRTAILNKDLPLSLNTVTKELIADRQAFQLADAVKIAPGVIPSSFYNQYAIRGISQNEEGQIINGLRTRQYYFLQPLTTNIERVEVIKGPASATFSSVDPGGSINLVTKKPLAVDRKEITLSAGSFSTIRGALDFTGPLNKEKTLLYRINGAIQQAQSYRDLVRNNAVLISPSFSYVPNDKTAINAELIYSDMTGNLDRGQPIFGAVAGVTNLNSTPISLNLGAPNDFFRSKEFIASANLSHKFSKAIAFNAIYMKQTWMEDLQEHRTTNAFAPDTTNAPVNSLVQMQFVQRKQNWNTDNVNAYFTFDFRTGAAKHQLLIGYDFQGWQKLRGGGQNAARGFLLTNGTVANSFVRANAASYQIINVGGRILPRPNVPYFDLANPSYTIRNSSDYNVNVRTALPSAYTTTNAVYIQEQLQWKGFTLLASLRKEWFKDITNHKTNGEASFTNTVLLPRIGLTYAVTKNINVYGTYLQGFQPQSNTVTLMPNTGSFFNTAKSAAQFKPLESDLKEFGAKADVFGGRMRINAAVYEINQRNLLMNANLPAFPDSLVTRGAERSRGFEIEVAGYIQPNWQVNASYSYIDARITEDNDKTLIGARKQNTPFNSANLWMRYNFTNVAALRDLGIGVGIQHNGDRVPWFTRAFNTPAYTLLDLALYFTPGGNNLQVSANVNNVTNQTYWIGAQTYQRLFPGAPRNIFVTATYRF
jgi:iron complex outermembrane recepter protein